MPTMLTVIGRAIAQKKPWLRSVVRISAVFMPKKLVMKDLAAISL